MGGMHVTIWWNDNDSGFILDKQLKWTFRKTTVRMLTCLSTRMHHPDPQQTSICSYSLLNVACLAQRHPELFAPFPKRKISGTRAFPQVKKLVFHLGKGARSSGWQIEAQIQLLYSPWFDRTGHWTQWRRALTVKWNIYTSSG